MKRSHLANIEAREAHYRKFLGKLDQPVMHSTDDKPVHVDIYQFAPRRGRDFWTLITGGVSDEQQHLPKGSPKHVSSRIELMMYAKKPQGWMFSVLKGLGEMPSVDCTYLHWYHTVPNGMPMTTKPSLLTAFFFLPPFFEKEGFDTLRVKRARTNVLWVVPITEAELDFARAQGSDALEALMVERELDPVVNERRKSLV